MEGRYTGMDDKTGGLEGETDAAQLQAGKNTETTLQKLGAHRAMLGVHRL